MSRTNNNVRTARNDRHKAPNTKYKQELTSRSRLLRHRLDPYNMVITPSRTFASGSWTHSQEHEKLIRSTQRKMLRLVQTKRKYKTTKKNKGHDRESTSDKELAEDKRSQQNTTANSDEGDSTNTGCDQDSDVSCQSDSDDDMDTAEVEEEEWIEYIKMRAANIPCWRETQRK